MITQKSGLRTYAKQTTIHKIKKNVTGTLIFPSLGKNYTWEIPNPSKSTHGFENLLTYLCGATTALRSWPASGFENRG